MTIIEIGDIVKDKRTKELFTVRGYAGMSCLVVVLNPANPSAVEFIIHREGVVLINKQMTFDFVTI